MSSQRGPAKQTTILVTVFMFLSLQSVASVGQRPSQEALKQEELEDHYRKWVDEDVLYIITEEERAVYEGLSTPEEKEQFIEQFWFRRDPDPRTIENEFKEEHYRRIAYANERFTSGLEGWRTDRGRVYIIHGPPAEIQSHAGGVYERPINEGGGSTATFPFEVWRYRHIERLGSDITLEFVDRSFSGEYRLALYPEEKDALLNTPGAGLTLAEELGLASKADRPWFNPAGRESMLQTAGNNPFDRYETYAMVQAPQRIKYSDLKELVSVDITYSSMPFEVHEDYFRLNQDQVIVPLNIQVKNKELGFEIEADRYAARVAVYGVVTSISNRLVTEFDDDLVTTFPLDRLDEGLQKDSIYQKVLILDRKQRYKLDLVVRDQGSEKIGTIRKAIVPPNLDGVTLASSSVIFSNTIRVLGSLPDQDEMFVLGDVKVLPNLRRQSPIETPLGVYFQIYNAQIDQSTNAPSLKLQYRLLKDGEVVRQTVDTEGASIQHFSEHRIVIVKRLEIEGLLDGKYSLQVEVEDQLTGQNLKLVEPFELTQPQGS